jgi:hypothetical protein
MGAMGPEPDRPAIVHSEVAGWAEIGWESRCLYGVGNVIESAAIAEWKKERTVAIYEGRPVRGGRGLSRYMKAGRFGEGEDCRDIWRQAGSGRERIVAIYEGRPVRGGRGLSRYMEAGRFGEGEDCRDVWRRAGSRKDPAGQREEGRTRGSRCPGEGERIRIPISPHSRDDRRGPVVGWVERAQTAREPLQDRSAARSAETGEGLPKRATCLGKRPPQRSPLFQPNIRSGRRIVR